MQDEWAELSEIEARVTAADRLDLHYEHRDALDVERGSWRLSDYLRAFAHIEVRVGDHSVRGDILAVGSDWVQLATALAWLPACDGVAASGTGQPSGSVLDFRQAVRQVAGRIPREIVLRNGRSRLVTIDWVARDFLHVRDKGRETLIPLSQVAVVFGRIELG